MKLQVSAKVDLSRIPLFEGIDDRVIAVDQDWLSYYHDKQNIYIQGEPADSLIVILHGQAEILSEDTYLVMRRASDVVGEQGFLTPDERRTATVVARGTVQALRLPRAEVDRLLATSLQFTRNLLRIVSAKLAEATSEREFRYRNEHRLIAAFNSHLAPEITAQLLASGDDYGRARQIEGVVLFADIRGFTSTSLKMSPTTLALELGDYLDEMVRILHKHHAYVDKFIGDAVMGVWGFPFQSDRQASHALSCARQMVERAAEKKINGDPVRIAVGLSAGEMFCGNVGSDLKRQFTVIGPPVNLASRCESACRDLDAAIVLSEDVYQQLAAQERQGLLAHPNVAVKGVVGEVCLYAVEAKDMTASPR